MHNSALDYYCRCFRQSCRCHHHLHPVQALLAKQSPSPSIIPKCLLKVHHKPRLSSALLKQTRVHLCHSYSRHFKHLSRRNTPRLSMPPLAAVNQGFLAVFSIILNYDSVRNAYRKVQRSFGTGISARSPAQSDSLKA